MEDEKNAFKKEQELAAKLARLKELEAKEEAAKQQSLQQLPNNNFSFPPQYSGFLYSQSNAVGRNNLGYNYSQQIDPRLMTLQYSNYVQQNNPYTIPPPRIIMKPIF